MSAADEVKSVVFCLRMLLESEPASAEQVSAWYKEAEALKRTLQSSVYGIDVPHLIWHYFDDADIRFRDRDYAQSQISAVEKIIEEWGGSVSRAVP
ncbi:hypothetical protein [Stenotrophomonas sp. 24(2023)]|uniref:hypothetical protein n=1 Tax=Stenotrophomonas sp. 24(2023) TaxID=3068324 RepID=UPI0027E1FA8A|nr:hypothetical protein [Stenotrophomonas sp. 24(2023)]WMJ68160.1 hypothetical protein Q9R17_13230 [Stenotrophomonas sp. 24(2023)]